MHKKCRNSPGSHITVPPYGGYGYMRVCDHITHRRKKNDRGGGRAVRVYMPKLTPLTPIGVSGAATVMDRGVSGERGGFIYGGRGAPRISPVPTPYYEHSLVTDFPSSRLRFLRVAACALRKSF